MSRLKVLLVDDETLARTRLITLLGDINDPPCDVVGEAANAAQALQWLQQRSADVALLDIHMPGMSGMELAPTLRALPAAPAIIFVTAHPEHALDAFEVDALDYLTKPVKLERLQAALQKVKRLAQIPRGPQADLPHETLLIQDRGRTERVPIAEVLYFKAELKYITVRTAAKTYILDSSLGELEERYGARFLRVHRNALVARSAIRAIEKHYDSEEGDGWAIRFQGLSGELIAVSRRQLAAVRAAVAQQ
jgi:two-component system, LytTR family, response regulator AlgR